MELSLTDDIRRTAEICVKCNICTASCPVVPVTDLFPGPKYVGPQAQRFRDPHFASPDASLDYCSGCGVCTMVCPHGVKVMEINTVAKAELRNRQLTENPFDLHLWRNWLLGRNELLGQIGSPVAPIANLTLRVPLVRRLMQEVLGIDVEAPFPTFSFTTLRRWFYHIHKAPARPSDRPVRQVIYFHGCAANYYEPSVGQAIVAVLEHNGFEVLVPPQSCCGLPMQSNGDFAGARASAYDNIAKLAPYARQGIPIVVGGTSCGLELKSDYREILGIHTADASLLGEHVYDINEFLWLEHEAGRLRTDFQPLLGEMPLLPVHTSCHQKLHRMGRPALDLLGIIPGLNFAEMGFDCCGIAGTYGYKHEKHAIAQAVGQPLFDKVINAGSRFAVCDNETCRWNLAQNTGLHVVHTVQVLADAYGLPGCQLDGLPVLPDARSYIRAHADRFAVGATVLLAAAFLLGRARRS
jgi:glycerol-3-phosphate dehydrogenase subunit C